MLLPWYSDVCAFAIDTGMLSLVHAWAVSGFPSKLCGSRVIKLLIICDLQIKSFNPHSQL